MKPQETIRQFDTFLADRGLRFEAVVIGGAALGLLGVTSRQTRDCDILDPQLPEAIAQAAIAFAQERRSLGDPLADDWLNNGPSSLTDVLPPDWRAHLRPVFTGEAVVLRSLGRLDLLRSKLFALCDRGTDIADCLALSPTGKELRQLRQWVHEQDGNPDWPEHVDDVFADLGERLDHGL